MCCSLDMPWPFSKEHAFRTRICTMCFELSVASSLLHLQPEAAEVVLPFPSCLEGDPTCRIRSGLETCPQWSMSL